MKSNISISDCLKTPEKYIPEGLYCYHKDYICPFWDLKRGEYPEQEDGYCHFLGKSDWDINKEYKKKSKIIKSPNEEHVGKLIEEVFDDTYIDPISGKITHMIMSLLWDQCKECGINLADPEDIELTTITSEEIQEILNKRNS